jgi:hypothetical protein
VLPALLALSDLYNDSGLNNQQRVVIRNAMFDKQYLV